MAEWGLDALLAGLAGWPPWDSPPRTNDPPVRGWYRSQGTNLDSLLLTC